MENLLHKLQNADDTTKRRWGAAITAALMVFVVYVWLAYFNTLVGPERVASSADAAGNAGFSFWGTMKSETALIYDSLKGYAAGFGELIRSPKEYAVEPAQNNH